MSNGLLASLGIELYADSAKFTGDLGKAERAAKSFADNTVGHFTKIQGAITGLAASLGVLTFAAQIKSVAEMRDGLGDLADAGLGTVESLSRIKNSANAFGGSFDDLTKSLGKMVNGLAGSDKETSKAGEALRRLGIDARDAAGQIRLPSVILEELAIKLAGYKDGADKAAYAQAILGKGGERYLPVLKDMAELGAKAATVTQKQADEADRFLKSLAALNKTLEGSGKKIAGEFIVPLTGLIDVFNKTAEQSNGLKKTIGELAADGSIESWADKVVYSMAFAIDAVRGVVTIFKVVGEAIASGIAALDAYVTGVATARDRLKKLDFAGALGATAEARASILDIAKISIENVEKIYQGNKSLRFEFEARLGVMKKIAEQEKLNASLAAQGFSDQVSRRYNTTPPAKAILNSTGLWTLGKVTQEAEKYLAILDRINGKDTGLEPKFFEDLKILEDAFRRGLIPAKQYSEAIEKMTKQQPFFVKQLQEEAKALEYLSKWRQIIAQDEVDEIAERDKLINAMEDGNARLQLEIETLGMTDTARQLYLLGLEKEAALKLALTDKDQAYIRGLADQRAAMVEQKRSLEDQSRVWDSLSTFAGDFFGNLIVNGKSAFDSLRQSLKSFAAELIAFFAKRWILQMVAGFGGTFGTAAQAALTAQNGTPLGSMLGPGSFGSAVAPFAASAVAGGLGGYYGARALGAGEHGQNVGAGTGATLAMLGMAVAGPIGAAVGALAGAIIGKFTDPDGLATRTGSFGAASLMGGDQMPNSSFTSAFGKFGIGNTHWFGNDQQAGITQFLQGLTGLDNSVAARLKDKELERVIAALQGKKDYAFGTEHTGDDAATFGQILKDRVHDMFAAIDPQLQKMVDAFTGTGDQLGAFVLDLLDVRSALEMTKVPDLTLESLVAMQQAGESLGQTFMRVANDFLNAQASLNAAIGARNPAFARETVLSQRNSLAQQFAGALGLNFGEELLARMALHPETFAGLNTETMNLLAGFLNLQTQLEQLDGQLASTGTGSLAGGLNVVSSAIDNAASAYIDSLNAMISAQNGLADYLRGSLLSDLSPLTPNQQYQESRTQFNRLVGLAQGGDVDAINQLGGARDSFLRASRGVNASNGQYNTDFYGTFDQLNAISGFQASRPMSAGDAQAQTAALIAQLQIQTAANVQANALLTQLILLIGSGLTTNDPAVRALLDEIRMSIARSGPGVLTSSGPAVNHGGSGPTGGTYYALP